VPAGPAPGDRRALLVADAAAAACRRAARLVDAVADERAGVAARARPHRRGPPRGAVDPELARVERDAAELVRSLVATAGELQAVAAGLAASSAAAP